MVGRWSRLVGLATFSMHLLDAVFALGGGAALGRFHGAKQGCRAQTGAGAVVQSCRPARSVADPHEKQDISQCEMVPVQRGPRGRCSGSRPRAGGRARTCARHWRVPGESEPHAGGDVDGLGRGVETWPALCLHSTPIPAFPLPGGRGNFLTPQPRRHAAPIASSRTPQPARAVGGSYRNYRWRPVPAKANIGPRPDRHS